MFQCSHLCHRFVERNTGAKSYFEVPLHRTLEIFHKALKKVPGTARTVRGPSMSAAPGKVEIVGTSEIPTATGIEKVFVLQFLQARNADWCDADKVFYAKYDENAYWFDDLVPAFGAKEWFWEAEFKAMENSDDPRSSGQLALGRS